MRLFKRNYIWLVSIIIVCLFWGIFFIINKCYPFGTNSLVNHDMYYQVWPFLIMFRDRLLSGEGIGYIWNIGLGMSFLPLYFYYLASPINLLVVFFSETGLIGFLNMSVAIKSAISAGTFAFYLQHIYSRGNNSDDEAEHDSVNSIAIIPLSCAYALSGYICGYYHEIMWFDSYMIFPLIMYGYSCLIRDKKPYLYILTLAFSAYCNFYMTFIIAVFLILWFFIDNYDSWHDFLMRLLRFAGASLLAVGMSFFPLIISFLAIENGGAGDSLSVRQIWFGSMFDLLKYQFIFSKPVTISYVNNVANLYCGTFAISLFVMYIFCSKLSLADRIKRTLLLLFLYISLNSTILNYIWHGFHNQVGVPNRFSFLIIFILLISSYEMLKEEIKIDVRSIVVLVLSVFIPITIYFFTDYDSIFTSKTELIVSLLILIVYSSLLILCKHLKIIVQFCLPLVMFLEIMLNGFFVFNFELVDMTATIRYLQNLSGVEDVIDSNDIFYRISCNNWIRNKGCFMRQNGVEAFCSMCSNDVGYIMNCLGGFVGKNDMPDYGVFEPLGTILGVRYKCYISDYPVNDSNSTIYQDDNYIVDQNSNSLGLIYATNKDIKDINYDSNDAIYNLNQLTYSISGVPDVIREIVPSFLITTDNYDVYYGDGEWMSVKLIPNNEGNGVVDVAFIAEETDNYNMYIDDSWPVSIIVEVAGKTRLVTSDIDQTGIVCIGDINKGEEVRVRIISHVEKISDWGWSDDIDSSDAQYLSLRFYVVDEVQNGLFVDLLHNNQMDIQEFKSDRIKGQVHIDENQVLFTTIPYDKGWHLYEDGKEIMTEKYAGAFVGADLGAGNHNIELRFVPRGLYIGIVITIISWLIFAMLLFLSKSILKSKSHERC